MRKLLLFILFFLPLALYAQDKDETGIEISAQDIPRTLESQLNALKSAEANGDKIKVAHSEGSLGNIYLQIARQPEGTMQPTGLISADKKTNLNTSIDYSNKAIAQSEEVGDMDQYKASYKILYAAQKLSGNVSGAMTTYSKILSFKKAIFSSKKTKEFELKRVEYDSKRREDSMRREQQRQQELAAQQLKEQNEQLSQQQQALSATQRENAKVNEALQQTQTDLTIQKNTSEEQQKQLTLAEEQKALQAANMQLQENKLRIQQDQMQMMDRTLEEHKKERLYYIVGLLGLLAFSGLAYRSFMVQKRSNRELENINNIVKAINSEINFSSLMRVLLQKTKSLDDERAIMIDYNGDSRIFRVMASFGYPDETIEGIKSRANEITIDDARAMFTSGAKEVYPDIFYRSSVDKNIGIEKLYGKGYEMKSMLVIAIKVNQTSEGFLVLEHSGKENAFGSQDFNVLRKLREHLVSAFIKIDLLEDIQNKVTALNETIINLNETRDQLVRQEKLASIGQLTKGIVDRILNPLMYINEFSKIAREDTSDIVKTVEAVESIPAGDKDEIEDLYKNVDSNLQKVMDHGASATRIVKGMQKIIREKSTDYTDTDVNQLIQKIVQQVIRKEYPEDTVAIKLDLDKKNEKIKILAEIETAIVNMISNSCYATIDKAKTTTNYKPEVVVTTLFKTDSVEIKVRDNGKGIPAKEMQQLFSPFFTTKPTSVGTGLGLYIAQDIVKTHKGDISVTSKEGDYTEFITVIPKR